MRVFFWVYVCRKRLPKKRTEIMLSFFVSDMNSRKPQHRLNEKFWLVENNVRTHGTWRNNGPYSRAVIEPRHPTTIVIKTSLFDSLESSKLCRMHKLVTSGGCFLFWLCIVSFK